MRQFSQAYSFVAAQLEASEKQRQQFTSQSQTMNLITKSKIIPECRPRNFWDLQKVLEHMSVMYVTPDYLNE